MGEGETEVGHAVARGGGALGRVGAEGGGAFRLYGANQTGVSGVHVGAALPVGV